jgi:hypothetical protein
MKTAFLLSGIFAASLFLYSCGVERPDQAFDCATSTLSVGVTGITGAPCGVQTGEITAAASGGNGAYRFKLDDGPFQSSGTFKNVKPGIYTVTVIDELNCTNSVQTTVTSGISFQESIRPIIERSCAIPACHDGSGNISYLVFENIKKNPADIKNRTQTRNMPKTGSLTDAEIEMIACWVDDGAPNN